jgi:hypothetical protein
MKLPGRFKMTQSRDYWVPKTNQGLLNLLYGMNSDPDSTALVTQAINTMLFEKGLVRIERLMFAADLSKLHVGVGLAMLRGTFLVKDEISCWTQFREKVRHELELREMDSHKLMDGLYS